MLDVIILNVSFALCIEAPLDHNSRPQRWKGPTRPMERELRDPATAQNSDSAIPPSTSGRLKPTFAKK